MSRRKSKTATPTNVTLQPGTVLDGRWRILKQLGTGGMGSVYEAQHVVNGRHAAIKVLHPDLAASRPYRQAFLREGRVDNLVDDAVPRVPAPEGPGAVRVYDDGVTSSGAPYMVMEKLSGHSVADLERPMHPLDAAMIIDGSLRVLEGAHRRGVVHRDIKPENLFYTTTHDVKVLDFGLAQLPGDAPTRGATGTMGYAPPEQVLGRRATPASDVWSVGATGYSLLTGKLPVDGDFQLDVVRQLGGEQGLRGLRPDLRNFTGCPVHPVRDLAPDTPPEIAAVIDRALDCDPKARYMNAKAMREDLERAVQAEMARQNTGTGTT